MSLDPTSYLARMLLSAQIIEEFEEEFSVVHLSRNLIDTIDVNISGEDIQIEIPAEMYNIDFWLKKGIIVYDKTGKSYATEVDQTGGFSGKHVNFVERCIRTAVLKWCNSLGEQFDWKEEE